MVIIPGNTYPTYPYNYPAYSMVCGPTSGMINAITTGALTVQFTNTQYGERSTLSQCQ